MYLAGIYLRLQAFLSLYVVAADKYIYVLAYLALLGQHAIT